MLDPPTIEPLSAAAPTSCCHERRTNARLDNLFSQHEMIHFIATYGYGVVALVIFLECLGLPLPGETILIAAAI